MTDTSKVALIVGGGGGMGAAAARGFHEAGFKTALADISWERAQAVAKALGKDVLAFGTDVRSEQSVTKLVKRVLDSFERIDVLLASHGVVTGHTLVHNTDESEWDFVLDTNLKGTFLCMKHVAPIMIKQKSGCILNLTTNRARAYRVPYSASKYGIEGVTEAAAEELKSFNIGVYALAPGGYVDTFFHDNSYRQLTYKNYAPEKELRKERKPLKPEVIVPLCLYLAQDASLALTGKKIDCLHWNEEHGLGRNWYNPV
ncbi:MAG: SDR family oxidoreductase [Thaumarchaeota archaeon]|nr:SDR family oxidoreductase [Nitrososphaerota archaeon]